jgi:hypothetical protein
MRRAASWTWIGLTLLVLGTGCSSQGSLPPQGQVGSGGMGWGGSENIAGRTGSGGNGVGGYICDGVGVIPGNCFGGMTGGAGRGSGGTPLESLGGRTGSAGKDGGSDTDAVVCCPPDPIPTSCMHLGGSPYNGTCYETCDFWCSTNWRTEPDEHGCPMWRYDIITDCSPFDAGTRI